MTMTNRARTIDEAVIWQCPQSRCGLRILWGGLMSPTCPECARRGVYVVMRPSALRAIETPVTPGPVKLGDVPLVPPPRRLTGTAVDPVLGGGLVPGQVILLAGPGGQGKTRLMLQWCDALPSVMISAEMGLGELRRYGDELGAAREAWVFAHGDLDAIGPVLPEIKPELIVVDSAQAAWCADTEGAPGTMRQMLAVTARARRWATMLPTRPAVVVICQVTKTGDAAGPEQLKHLVDTECYLEAFVTPIVPAGGPDGVLRPEQLRGFRVGKNRMGPGGLSATLRLSGAGRFQ